MQKKRIITLAAVFILIFYLQGCQSLNFFSMSNEQKIMQNKKKLRKKLIEASSLNIVCFGNSITYGYTPFTGEQAEIPYPKKLKSLLTHKRSGKKTTVINSGVPGWTTVNAELYIDQKVLQKKPDFVLIMFGINDSLQEIGPERYKSLLKEMVQILKKNNIDILLLTPTPIYSWKNIQLKKYVKKAKEVALEEQVPYVDLFQYYINNYTNKDRKALLPDTVHFDPVKYSEIAEVIYQDLIESDLEFE